MPDEEVSQPTQTIIRTVGHWEKTWGAIADASNGLGGVTVGEKSKKAAEKSALTACAEQGGTECKISMTYRNQCVAIIQPVIASAGARGTIQVAESAEIASRLGISICERDNKSNCKIAYSACSEPVYFND